MKHLYLAFCTPLLLWPAPSALLAAILPSPLFGDHAVLQRDVPVPVWGTADPGEKITVQCGDAKASASADADGRWRATLPPLSIGPARTLVFTGEKDSVTSRDIVVGDVWLCSGQSNMEFPVAGVSHAQEEIAAAAFPLIRHFKTTNSAPDAPARDVSGKWVVCSPASVASFTAVGYFFARDLHRRDGTPQGLINSSWGGTAIEAWIPHDVLEAQPEFHVALDRWKKLADAYPAKHAAFGQALAAWTLEKQKADASHTPYPKPKPNDAGGAAGDRNAPGACFNGMIAPLVPCALRGILWYQGEANWMNPDKYGALFRAMITDWRQRWGAPQLPFLFIQLPNYITGNALSLNWAILRESQTSALQLPATDRAVTLDVGDPNQIHYPDKQDVGRRLALAARRTVFGEKDTPREPTLVSAGAETNALRVHMDGGGSPLVLKPLPAGGIAFELAGGDHQFHPADAELNGDEVIIRSAEVPEPVAARYCWHSAPNAILFNEAGLPAAPFRTDDWPYAP
jgi:sialate O-acetylesterase